jgi:hypothetical protein
MDKKNDKEEKFLFKIEFDEENREIKPNEFEDEDDRKTDFISKKLYDFETVENFFSSTIEVVNYSIDLSKSEKK